MTTFALVYNSLQANTITLSLHSAFGWDRTIVGVVVSILIALVICGGAHFVARVAEMLVPVMAGAYLLIALIVVIMNFGQLPSVFALIISNAFAPQAAVAGGFGACVMNGIKRGLFSNEAGEGSVPNAAATAYVTHPVKQGLIQAFGVYVDTLLICSASAALVLLSGVYEIGGKVTGIELIQNCLAAEVGSWAIVFIGIMIMMFAFSSLVGNYYYGEINLAFLTQSKTALYIFRAAVVAMTMFGSIASLPLVWNLADLFMAFLATTNLYAISRLFPFAKIALDDYEKQRAKAWIRISIRISCPALTAYTRGAWKRKNNKSSSKEIYFGHKRKFFCTYNTSGGFGKNPEPLVFLSAGSFVFHTGKTNPAEPLLCEAVYI